MPPPPLLRHAADVTPEWLTDVLRRRRCLGAGRRGALLRDGADRDGTDGGHDPVHADPRRARSRPGQRGRQVRLGRRPEPRHRPGLAGLRDRGPLLPRGRRPHRRAGAGGLSGRGGARHGLVHPVDGGHRRRRPGRSDRGVQPGRRGGRPRRNGRSARAVLGGARTGRPRVAQPGHPGVRRLSPRPGALPPSRLPGALRRHARTGAPGGVPPLRRAPAGLSASAGRAPHRQPRRLPSRQSAVPAGQSQARCRRLADRGLGRCFGRRGVLHRGLPRHRGPSRPRAGAAGALPRRAAPPWRARLFARAVARRQPARHLRRHPDGHRRVHGRAADGTGRPHVPHQRHPPRAARARCGRPRLAPRAE